jgi:hypothetical protein
MTQRELLERLHVLLTKAHAKFGQEVDRLEDFEQLEIQAFSCGRTGVIAFIGEYVLTGWEDHDIRRASRDAYRHLGDWLKVHGFTRHMVYPRNFRSVILTRKLGAKPVGIDQDGYVHYLLTYDDFLRSEQARLHPSESRHGQEVPTAESA